MRSLRSAVRWLIALDLRGEWKPGAHNIVLLIVQVVLIWTAAQRGLDYAQTTERLGVGPQATAAFIGIEKNISLTTLGLGFLVPAGVAFLALAMGWSRPLSLGHLFLGAAYLTLGYTFLKNSPVESWPLVLGGALLLGMASVLLISRSEQIPDLVGILAGMACLIVGGWLASQGLGSGYRTGNGFLGVGVIHVVIGFGTQVLARRDLRLQREEDAYYAENPL